MADERLFPLTPTDIRLKKDLGQDSSTNNYSAHAKLDITQTTANEILTDTADIQPRLITVEADVANVQTSVDELQTNLTSIDTRLTDPTTGLAAIATKADNIFAEVDDIEENLGTPTSGTVASHVESVEAKLGTPTSGTVASHVEAVENLIGLPSNGTVSADISQLDSKLGQIQNNTRTVIALNTELEIPPVGQTKYFKLILTNYDTVGNMEEPDLAPVLNVETANGVSKDSNVGDWDGTTFAQGTSMIKISDGRYYTFYRVPATETVNTQLVFNFTIVEGGLTRFIVRTALIVPEISASFTASDRIVLNGIDTNVEDIQTKLGTPSTTVSGDIAAVKAQTQSIESKTDIIDANLDTVKDSLIPEIRTKSAGVFDRETMSLEALAEVMSVIAESSLRKIWNADKISGTIAASGGVETVVMSDTEGVYSIAGVLNAFKVNPTTTCRKFTVEIFEDNALNNLLAKVSDWDSLNDGQLNVCINRDYINANAEKKLYVKITNDSTTPASFVVSLRGERGFVA